MSGVLKAGYLMLGVLSNTFKVPVNGYLLRRRTIMYKKLACLGFIILGLILSSDASGELIAHWTLNDASGNVAKLDFCHFI